MQAQLQLQSGSETAGTSVNLQPISSDSPPGPTYKAPRVKRSELVQRGLRAALLLGQEVEQRRNGMGQSRRRSMRWLARNVFARPISSLWRAWAIARLAERYPEVASFQHVGVGHISTVLTLPEHWGVALLRAAERGRWSRERLCRVMARCLRLYKLTTRGSRRR